MQGITDRRLSAEGYLSGDQRCLKKVEYAAPVLAAGNESFYYGQDLIRLHGMQLAAGLELKISASTT